jgi:hypothetical protein
MAKSDHPRGQLEYWEDIIPRCRERDDFDCSLTPEVQTDKHLVKAVPCQFCKRPLIVTTFYVLAWAKCSICAGESNGKREKGSVGQAQAGRTPPSLAMDLEKVLINQTFARALCPVHPDDPDHVMELKNVSHSKNHGPYHVQFVSGRPTLVQTAPGETVLHQCGKCNATVAYSTAVTVQFKRCNEPDPRGSKHSMGMASWLGVREELDPSYTSLADQEEHDED